MMKNDILNTKKLGYKFYFQDGDDQIACFGSYFTGKEEIYVNDDLVSSKGGMGVSSKHSFEYAGNTFQVSFDMQNILTGKLVCTVFKNQQRFSESQQTSLISNPKASLKVIAWSFFGGLVGGYLLIALLELLLGEF